MIGKDILYLIFNTWYYWTILTTHRQSIFHSLYFYISEQSDIKEFSQKVRARVERYNKDMTQYNHNPHFSS